MKHTPGPWKEGTRGPNKCGIIGTEKGMMICMLAGNSVEFNFNANLIAAAPELLEALELCKSRLVLHASDIGDYEALETATKAIQKAIS